MTTAREDQNRKQWAAACVASALARRRPASPVSWWVGVDRDDWGSALARERARLRMIRGPLADAPEAEGR